MKLATLKSDHPDGRLAVVSRTGDRWLPAACPTLQAALDDWAQASAELNDLARRLAVGEGEPMRRALLAAPLPRAWQWLDGSAFTSHGELMERLFNTAPAPRERPLMYQGMSHQFLGPHDDVVLPSEDDGIDFEGEFGVITDQVPMGVTADAAMAHVKLVVQINDWSLRTLAPIEMKTGFGWVQAKPACSVAPFAVTPDELGSSWQDGRVCLPLTVERNGATFGAPNGVAMGFGFHELIAHAAATRSLCAGTIIGSGTVSNASYREVGSTCIAERRAIEMLDFGAPSTPFLSFGERVRMEAVTDEGGCLFGSIDQVVKALG